MRIAIEAMQRQVAVRSLFAALLEVLVLGVEFRDARVTFIAPNTNTHTPTSRSLN